MGHLKLALLKLDALLTWRRVCIYSISVLLLMLGGLLLNFVAGNPPFYALGTPIMFDFSAYVVGGRMALNGEPAMLYDLLYQSQVQRSLYGGVELEAQNIYLAPPFVAYLHVPFAVLPYMVSVVVWALLTVALLVLSLRLLWPLVPHLHRYGLPIVLVIAFGNMPAFELLAVGQNSAVSLIIFVLGLRLLLARRDFLAGSVLALGLFKPQLFILVPMLLLLQRRWRALGAWSVVAATLTIVSIVLVGFDGVHAYIDLLTSDVYREQLAEGAAWKMLSLAALVRHLGLESFVPLVSGMALLALVALFGRHALKQGDDRHFTLLYAVSVLMIFIVSPHLFLYDGILFLLPALILLNEDPYAPGIRVALTSAYVTTFFTSVGILEFPDLAPGPWLVAPVIALLLIARRMLAQDITEQITQHAVVGRIGTAATARASHV